MVIDFSQKIVDIITGKAIPNPDKTDFTLKNAAVEALLSNPQQNEVISAEEKVKRFEIATRLIKEEKPDFKTEEIAKIKELIGKVYTTTVVGQAFEMLEGEKN